MADLGLNATQNNSIGTQSAAILTESQLNCRNKMQEIKNIQLKQYDISKDTISTIRDFVSENNYWKLQDQQEFLVNDLLKEGSIEAKDLEQILPENQYSEVDKRMKENDGNLNDSSVIYFLSEALGYDMTKGGNMDINAFDSVV